MPNQRLNVTPSATRITGDHGTRHEPDRYPNHTTITADMTSWTGAAGCHDPRRWDTLDTTTQIATCHACPVQAECATQAVDLVRNDPGARLVPDVIYAGLSLRDWWGQVRAGKRPIAATSPNAKVQARLERLFELHAEGYTPEQVSEKLGVSLGALADNLRRWHPDHPAMVRTYLAARNRQRRKVAA